MPLPRAALLALVVLLFLEGGLRAATAAGLDWAVGVCRPAHHQILEGTLWGRGNLVPWLHHPSTRVQMETPDGEEFEFTSNSEGFHDVEWIPAPPPEAARVIVLGDSHAAHVLVPSHRLWPHVLQARLEHAMGGQVRVYNLAVGGCSTGMEYEILQRYGPLLEPDLVLLQFTRNDIPETSVHPSLVDFHRGVRLRYLVPEDREVLRSEVDGLLMDVSIPLSRWSYLARAAGSIRGRPVAYSLPRELTRLERGPRKAARERTLRYLGGIAGLCRDRGWKLCILLDRIGGPLRPEDLEDQEWVAERLGEVVPATVIDTRDGFDGRIGTELARFPDQEHLTPEGHAALADWLETQVAPLLGQ